MVAGRKSFILLVDPDPVFHRTVRESLIPEGFLVVGIPKVHEAMHTAKDVRFDLLITDPMLPFALDLAGSMARTNPDQKVLFISDYSPGRVKSFGICPPDAEILQKPIAATVLSERVKICLSSGETWVGMASAWRGMSARQGRQEENQESSSLSEMA